MELGEAQPVQLLLKETEAGGTIEYPLLVVILMLLP